MQRVNLHARPSIIQAGCPTCCYQLCALNHAKVGDADLDYPSEPCHRNVYIGRIECSLLCIHCLFILYVYEKYFHEISNFEFEFEVSIIWVFFAFIVLINSSPYFSPRARQQNAEQSSLQATTTSPIYNIPNEADHEYMYISSPAAHTPVNDTPCDSELLLLNETKIHYMLMVVDRYLRLMGDKTIQNSTEPRVESYFPPYVPGIDVLHQGVID